jgi:hypothetical protein
MAPTAAGRAPGAAATTTRTAALVVGWPGRGRPGAGLLRRHLRHRHHAADAQPPGAAGPARRRLHPSTPPDPAGVGRLRVELRDPRPALAGPSPHLRGHRSRGLRGAGAQPAVPRPDRDHAIPCPAAQRLHQAAPRRGHLRAGLHHRHAAAAPDLAGRDPSGTPGTAQGAGPGRGPFRLQPGPARTAGGVRRGGAGGDVRPQVCDAGVGGDHPVTGGGAAAHQLASWRPTGT